jgi:hypothetical protein
LFATGILQEEDGKSQEIQNGIYTHFKLLQLEEKEKKSLAHSEVSWGLRVICVRFDTSLLA